jgi:Ankyrin repeats (many copies)/Ankyrin repeats (3 copies)
MRTSSRILNIVLVLLGTFLHGTTLATPTSTSAVDAGSVTTSLHLAADRDDIGAIAQRLDAGDAVDIRDERGMTPLHRAAVMGRLKAAGLLLDRGADPNARAEGQMTPLHFAAMLAHPEMAGLLARRGARTDLKNDSGMMPLHLAANDKVVRVLASAGADVNALTNKGLTPLHTARHGLVARALVDNKADLRIRTPKGRTPMELAGIETFEKIGLSIHSVMLGRLRGVIGQMPVTFTNVSAQPILDLRMTAQSTACTIDVTPASATKLLPGQNADMVMTMTRNPTLPEGEYPIYLTIFGDGHKIGETDLKVDTRMSVTPEDQGMIRLAKGQIRPASSRWFYLIYAAAPMLVILAWLLLRRR